MWTSLTTVCFPLSICVLFWPSSSVSLSVSLSLSVCLLMSFHSVALPHYAACSACLFPLAMILLKILTHARHTHAHTHTCKQVCHFCSCFDVVYPCCPSPIPFFPAFSSCLIFFLIFLGQLFKCSWRCYCCFSNLLLLLLSRCCHCHLFSHTAAATVAAKCFFTQCQLSTKDFN